MEKRKSLWLAIGTAITLIAWIATGSYLFSENCCGAFSINSSQSLSNQRLFIADGTAFKAEATSPIIFEINKATPQLFEEVSQTIFKTIEYIKSNPLKTIVITGYYGLEESSGKALGEKRAKALQKIFLDSQTPSYQVKIKTESKKKLLRDKEYLVGMVDFEFLTIATTAVDDDINDFNLKFDNNFAFKKSSSNLLMPLSENAKTNLAKIASYIKRRPSRKLLLKGYFLSEEQNNSGLPNLGLVRANKIKMLLTSLGATAKQIAVKAIEKPKMKVVQSSLYGAFLLNSIDFVFEDMTPKYIKELAKEKSRVERALKKKGMYRFKDFGSNEMRIVRDESLRLFMVDLIGYIHLNPKAVVYCVGHSNLSSKEELDYNKGYERADYIKSFLAKNGLDPNRIIVKSLGGQKPLAKLGSIVNRRVDLFVAFDGTDTKLKKYLKITPKKIKKELVKTKKKKIKKVILKKEKKEVLDTIISVIAPKKEEEKERTEEKILPKKDTLK